MNVPNRSSLVLGEHELFFKDCSNINDPYVNQIFEYITFLIQSQGALEPQYVETINECDQCGYGIEDKKNEFMKNPSDIWVFNVLSEDGDEDGFEEYDSDWKSLMGKNHEIANEEVLICRCLNCGKWFVDIN